MLVYILVGIIFSIVIHFYLKRTNPLFVSSLNINEKIKLHLYIIFLWIVLVYDYFFNK